MYKNHYQKYESEEQEVLVFIQRCLGAGYHKEGNYWDMTAVSLGMVFPNGSCVIREGRTEWPLNEEEMKGEYDWGRFARGQICRLRLRRMKPNAVPEYMTSEKFNVWLPVEVLEPAVSCPEFEAYWEEYQKPAKLSDEVLGKLMPNWELDWLEGEILWGDGHMSPSLEIDMDDTETWDKTRAFVRKLATDAARWDGELRRFATKELTEFANDWQSSEEENENAPEFTEEDFMWRIQSGSLVVSWDGNLVAYYDDDDLFFGHVIETSGIESGGLKYMNIVGRAEGIMAERIIEENGSYTKASRVSDVPWHRLTTVYGRATAFPAYFAVPEEMRDATGVRKAFEEPGYNVEHQDALWHATLFASVFLARISEKVLCESAENPVTAYLAEQLTEPFDRLFDCYHLGDTMEYAAPPPRFADPLPEEHLWLEEYDEEVNEFRYEEEDIFPDALFYSFYYYTWQAVLAE